MIKRILFLLVLLPICGLGDAQSVWVENVLRKLEMENISVAQEQDTLTAAFEPSVYRGVYPGIGEALRHLVDVPEIRVLQLVVLDNALPQLCITIPSEMIRAYQQKECSLEDIFRGMEMTLSTRKAMEKLKGSVSRYTSFGQTDLVLYPGVFLANNNLNKLYNYAIDIQPALEMQLWKGASIRAQFYFPIVNNVEGMRDEIRPGYLTLRQAFRIGNHWQGAVTAGNFSNERLGAALAFGYFSSGGRFTLGLEGGITGISHFYGDDRWMGKWKRVNGMLKAGYYVPQYNTQIDVEGGRFLYGDDGVRGTLSRYFGEYIVGVYALHADGKTNVGFHFSIPLPGKRRSRWHGMRVMLPPYFAFQYGMRGGGEYVRRRLGESYRTEPVSAENARFYQPDYIRCYLIKTVK